MLNWLISEEIIQYNPLLKIKVPGADRYCQAVGCYDTMDKS